MTKAAKITGVRVVRWFRALQEKNRPPHRRYERSPYDTWMTIAGKEPASPSLVRAQPLRHLNDARSFRTPLLILSKQLIWTSRQWPDWAPLGSAMPAAPAEWTSGRGYWLRKSKAAERRFPVGVRMLVTQVLVALAILAIVAIVWWIFRSSAWLKLGFLSGGGSHACGETQIDRPVRFLCAGSATLAAQAFQCDQRHRPQFACFTVRDPDFASYFLLFWRVGTPQPQSG
jgi:hypothetical protein